MGKKKGSVENPAGRIPGVERGGGHCDRARGNGHAASEILFSLWAGDIYTSPGRFVTSPALTSLPVAPRSPVNPPVSR